MIHIILPLNRTRRMVKSLILHRLPERLHQICGGPCEVVEEADENFRFEIRSPRRELSSHGSIRIDTEKHELEIDVIPEVREIERLEDLIRKYITDEVLSVLD
ncbi:MAG: hypothetical protein HYT48_02325 [Candidatus Vogelbacteria bacterium]|nr:hypothetical protein [Candidatus Vogelbacteria bacterium]